MSAHIYSIKSKMPLANDPVIHLRSCLEEIQCNQYSANNCIHCCSEERVTHFNELFLGAHISMAGENFKFNFCKSQFSVYKHHALVKSVDPINNGFSAIITMIHFTWTPFESSIRETKEIRHLYNYDIILISLCN